MLENAKITEPLERTKNSEWFERFTITIAEFGGTERDLATHFDVSPELVGVAVKTARAKGMIATADTLVPDDLEMLEVTRLGYRLAGMARVRKLRVKPGRDSIYKERETHRRAVASVAAAKQRWVQKNCKDPAKLIGELGVRLRGRRKYRYEFDLFIRGDGSQIRHCPDLVICPQNQDLAATVIEVLVEPRSEEELIGICRGWELHKRVAAVQFYVSAQMMTSLWKAIRTTETQLSTAVYVLPDPAEARALLELKPEAELICAATEPDPVKPPSVKPDPPPPVLSEAEKCQLLEILRWVGIWRVAGATAISINFEIPPDVALRLLRAGCEANMLELRPLHREDPVYRLTTEGARLVGVESEFRIMRRNMVYLGRRAHIAALLSKEGRNRVLNPWDLGAEAPTVQFYSGAVMQPSRADVLIEPGDKRGLIAVVLITDYQSRRTSESLCKAWFTGSDVTRVVFYAITDVLSDLERIIADCGIAEKVAALPVPLSDLISAKAPHEAQNQLSRILSWDRGPSAHPVRVARSLLGQYPRWPRASRSGMWLLDSKA